MACPNKSAIEIDSKLVRAYMARGALWFVLCEFNKCIDDATCAICLDATQGGAFVIRGNGKASLGDVKGAISDYEHAISLRPNDAKYKGQLAWWLSTSADAELRHGRRAVQLAMEACELTKWQDDHLLLILAAALAEVGDFDGAQIRLQQAIECAPNTSPRSSFKTRFLQ